MITKTPDQPTQTHSSDAPCVIPLPETHAVANTQQLVLLKYDDADAICSAMEDCMQLLIDIGKCDLDSAQAWYDSLDDETQQAMSLMRDDIFGMAASEHMQDKWDDVWNITENWKDQTQGHLFNTMRVLCDDLKRQVGAIRMQRKGWAQ